MTNEDSSPEKPVDPDFARAASSLLASGDVQGALTLAQSGTETYPRYATGFYVLGRSLEASGNLLEAAVALRSACRLAPDASVLRDALARIESAQDPAYQESAAPKPPEPVAETPRADDLEKIAKELTEAPRGFPVEAAAVPEPPPVEEHDDPSALLASATLAEIYVKQGQLTEAVRTYRVLIDRDADGTAKYGERLEELENQLRAQMFD